MAKKERSRDTRPGPMDKHRRSAAAASPETLDVKSADQLRHFDLVPAQVVGDPSDVVRDERDRVGSLVLSLALVFNDLKDLITALRFLNDAKKRAKRDEERGQVFGMVLHTERMMMGLVHELLTLVEKRLDVVNSPEFQEVVSAMRSNSRTAWNTIVAVARGAEGGDPNIRSELVFCRNALAFHYEASTKQLARGFRLAFAPDRPRPDLAVGPPAFSDGNDMEGARFYFVDGAVRAATEHEFDGRTFQEISKRASALARTANLGIKPLVMAHIRRRAKRIEPLALPANWWNDAKVE